MSVPAAGQSHPEVTGDGAVGALDAVQAPGAPSSGQDAAFPVGQVHHQSPGQAVQQPVGDTPTATEAPQRPPLGRSNERWLGGVASGIAEHLGWSPTLVRAMFVTLAFVDLLGVVIYGLLWVTLPARDAETPREAPGLESASRRGMRQRKQSWGRDAVPLSALLLLGVGSMWLSHVLGIGVSGSLVWPAVFAIAGVALVWRQADSSAHVDAGTAPWLRPFLSNGGWAGVTRLVLGLGLVGLAVSWVAASRIGLGELPRMFALSGMMIGGLVIAGAPWMYSLQRNLTKARDEKIVTDARADMAAHLHDSVLQSLALIQRQASDPKAVTSIARRQERELRAWLYGDQGPEHESVKAALTSDANDVEADRGVPIEVIMVGDAPITEHTDALVQAAREAMLNAAKHSGASVIDVYGEAEDGQLEVFVRDRGAGFVIDDVDPDRLGVRRSIIDRMRRHGGTASIRSAPGEGTEVRLSVPLPPE